MEKEPKSYYNERISGLEHAIRRSKRRLRMITFARLITFLLIFPSIFVVIPRMLLPGILLAVLFLLGFLFFIKLHLQKDRKHQHLKALLEINQQELKALNYEYSSFPPGTEFSDTRHPFSYDMDLFGEGSVFQFINRTVTETGKRVLAGLLTRETLEPEQIIDRQNAVKELCLMPALIQDFRASGNVNRENKNDNEILLKWVKQPFFYLQHRFYIYLSWFLPLLTFSVIIASVFIHSLIGVAISLYLLQLFIIASRMRHSSQNHQVIGKQLEILKKYQALLEVIEQGNYAGKELISISKVLYQGKDAASASIKKLTKILSAFDNRLNMLAAVFLEGLFLWDIQCMIRLEKWRQNEGSVLHTWLDALAEYDALVSLTTLAFNHPDFIYPVFSSTQILDSRELGHLLIPPGERVCNDFSLQKEGEFILITGANMAGKSTFLRTVATNMILAMAGAPVCAASFSFKPLALFSSMRTSDSLNRHESYFYAELRRLKELLDRLQQGEKLFIILDEILKGTNSTDKQKGSRAALQQILGLGGTGIVATHDLELAAIEKEFPEKVRNVCFEIEIDDARISFDYKLRKGITTKMNALLLMHQMGIIKD